jgi:hypothetical protein
VSLASCRLAAGGRLSSAIHCGRVRALILAYQGVSSLRFLLLSSLLCSRSSASLLSLHRLGLHFTVFS